MRNIHLTSIATTALLLANPILTSKTICPILGQQYPIPTNLSCSPKFLNATKSLTHALDSKIASHDKGFNFTTFSLGIFSTEETSPNLIYEYHHTDSSVANSSYGTNKADADSIYRIGSISKLTTVYLALMRMGERGFQMPITEYLHELKGLEIREEDRDFDAVLPMWEEITVGELAGQVGGLTRDYMNQPDFGPSLEDAFPEIPKDQVSGCAKTTEEGRLLPCSESEFIHGVGKQQPIFPSSYTPVYSNNGYGLMGAALERAVNASFGEIFGESLVRPLRLKGTSAVTPNSTTNGIVPGNVTSSGWNSDFGAVGPAGGHFSSTNDMAKWGRAILNSDLLPEATTRRWLKPTSFVEDFAQGVGMPWEIFRVKVDGYSVDLYTKAGDFGVYHTLLALIPQYGLGFTLMTATQTQTQTLQVREDTPNLITAHILPAVAQVAKDQALTRYGGHYSSPSINSSLTLSVDHLPGLKITSWISNGTDFLTDFLAKSKLGTDIRLIPNLLYKKNSTKVGFTGIFNVAMEDADPIADGDLGMWYGKCGSWFGISSVAWGDVGLEQFVFEMGDSGEIEGVVSKGLRVRMEKVGGK